MFENKVIRRIFGLKKQEARRVEKSHNEDL
jgi:hypothetical protein